MREALFFFINLYIGGACITGIMVYVLCLTQFNVKDVLVISLLWPIFLMEVFCGRR